VYPNFANLLKFFGFCPDPKGNPKEFYLPIGYFSAKMGYTQFFKYFAGFL